MRWPTCRRPGTQGKVKIGMDVAASEFMTEDKKYDLNFKEKDNDGTQVLTGCGTCLSYHWLGLNSGRPLTLLGCWLQP